ncbi:uncharacterized protein [Aegilops tauschii subsp. strangulata]|uniref:uncharacterized protein n=1 Tax=Aegilops tauschii subsp. strangulata TaxID=200361 RepID=UPI003CC8DD3B
MPTFALMVLRIPKKLLKEIDKCRHRFLWKQDEELTGDNCKVSWPVVCAPTSRGGLGITDLDRFSHALRLRWLWISWADPRRPWVGTTPPCNDEDKAPFAAATMITIGDGSIALFWHSSWIGPNTLASAYPAFFSHSKRKNRTIRDALRDDTWIEDLRHGDTQPLLQQFIELNHLIIAAAPELREGESDIIRWNQEAKGKYTSSSAYAMQFQRWL